MTTSALPFLLAGFLFAASASAAEVYRWTDEAGNLVFSDQPREGADKVEVPEISTVPALPGPMIVREPPQSAVPQGYNLHIARPGDQDTVRSNTGDVEVTFALDPPLRVRAGHRIAVQLDGAGTDTTTVDRYKLTGVERGAHTLDAWVIDSDDRPLSEAHSVTFYLHQASRLLRKPPPKAP